MKFTFKNQTLEGAVTKLRELKTLRKDIVLRIGDMSMTDDGYVVINRVNDLGGNNIMTKPMKVAHGHIVLLFGQNRLKKLPNLLFYI